MFILAFRFRRECAEQFPHDPYPADAAWTGPLKAPKLSRKWDQTKGGRLTCSWHKVGPSAPSVPF